MGFVNNEDIVCKVFNKMNKLLYFKYAILIENHEIYFIYVDNES